MVSKNNRYLNQQKSGRKFEKYSIKKLKVGAASVLVGAGFFFGYHVEASEVTKTESVVNANNEALGDKKINTQATVESIPNKENSVTEQPVVTGVVEEKKVETTISQAAGIQAVQTLQTTELQEKLSALQTEINRIRSNEQQKSQIEKAEKLVEEAKSLISSNTTTQTEVDAKAKEISSLTSILKSIKAEETPKENKNKDSRNGKKMEEGTGFRAGEEAATSTTTTTGIAADVVDATETPAVTRPPYTDKKVAEGLTKQIAWLDFADKKSWTNIDFENGEIYLKEGSIYEKEIMPDYIIKLKVKSLKPFQATEIYRKRMEANNATPEEKATFNPNATNGKINGNKRIRVMARYQNGYSEIAKVGVATPGKKTAIKGEEDSANIGIQFEVSGTYKGNVVRPVVIMADAESANPTESIILTTNGSGWQLMMNLKKNRPDAESYRPFNMYTKDYLKFPDTPNTNDILHYHNIVTAGEGNKIAPKFLTSPDQVTGGLGSGVFGPGLTAGKYSVPVVMTKNATEVGMYVLAMGAQYAMMGVAPVDEGDAPASYGDATHTINTRDGLTGKEVKQPYIGSERPDADAINRKDWHGDDDTVVADEGINQLLPDSLKGSEGNIIKANISNAGYYTLNIQAHTGGAEKAYVRSWLDFNNNGQFDPDEASDIAEITQDGDVKLHFTNKTQKDAEGLLAAGTRVRIATSREEIENPTGTAFSGEVEDFKAKITHPPKGDKQTTIGVMNETQRATVHFTPKGKNVYTQDDVNAEIDTTVPPVYINNKNGEKITLSDENTYTVIGEGTYKFTPNGRDVNVEFTPADGFVGKANGITIRRQDTNKITTDWGTPDATTLPNVNDVLNTMDGLYIPEVTVPTSVNVTPVNAESRNLQGLPQKGQPTFNVESAKAPVTASAKLVDPRTNAVTELTTVDALENGTTNKIGTYTIVPETGEVTFTPNKDFKGIPAPATISADVELTHDKDGNVTTKTLTATYTPTIIPVTPTAEASRTSGVVGKPQTSPIKLDTEETGDDKGKTVNFNKGTQIGPNGEHVELNPDTLTLLDGENEVTSVITTDGKYELDKANKTITFTPNATFTGEAKPVSVRIKDANGTKVDTTYTPTVTDVTMEGTPKETEAPQGQTQTGTPEFTVSSPDVRITGYKLINPTTNTPVDDEEIDVPNQGTYRIDKTTGTVKFIPKAGFTGPADGITVQAVTDVGKTHEAKYTPTVNPFVIIAVGQESKNIQGVPQAGTPTFTIPEDVTNASITSRKLVDPSDNTPKDSVTVEGKGTFVIDETGKVTFTPVPSYTGKVPAIEVQATATVTNEKNETATITQTATYQPEIVPLELGKTPATSTNLQGLEQKGTPIFTPKTIEVDGEPKTVSIEPGSYKLVKDNVEVAETTIPAYKKNTTEQIGTYTLNPSTGEVTFAPTDKTYTGEVEPVAVQVTGSNGVKVKTSYTPTIIPVTPSATEASTTKVQGATQEVTVSFTPGKATIGTAEKTVPMDPNAYKLLGGQEGKTPLDTVPAMSEDGTKEVGTYTIKVVDGQPVVTFTPTDKTYAGKLKPVTVQGKDTNGTEVTTTYTPVITPIVPTSENGTSEGPQGVEQTGRVTFNPGKEPGTENTPVAIDKTKMTLLGTDGNPVDSLTVSKDGKEIGTYILVKDPSGVPTGEVKFTPTDKSFVGEVPAATVQVKDANGTPTTATYTPTFTEVNPTSKPSETTGFQGLPQTSRVVLDEKDEVDNTTVNFDKGNDKVALVPSTLTLVNADGAKVASVTVPNEGTYELNNGVITFTPLPTFHGKASGVSVQAEDVNGKVAKTTYTPTVTEVRPVGTDAGSEGIQGAPQSGTPSFKSGNENIPMTVSATNPAKLVDPTTNQPIEATEIDAKNTAGEKVGKYTINPATGEVTFTPDPGFSGTPVPATVQAKDGNGTPTTATYIPVVKAAVPSGDNQVTSDIQGAVQTATPVFTQGKNTVNGQEVSVPFEATSKAKLIDPSKTGEEAEVTTLVVENQGTYTIDDNGVVTFTPLPTFKGEATEVSIVRKDKNGTPATAKYKPTVVGVTPSATEATTTKVQGATQETPVTFTPGKATIGTEEKTVPMDPNAYKLLGGENGTTPLDKVPVMSEDGTKEVGTYTIKVVDGQPVVTFTPTDKTYAGKLKPVTVQGKDTNGTEVTTTYTPVITPIVPTSENGTSEGPQGVEQTGRVTFNPGKEPGTENTPVEIDKSKMTLLGTDGTTPVESLEVSKDGKVIGTYTLVKDPNGVPTGEVKFTPTDKSYVGEVPPATVQVKDANGTPAKATYTPTLTKVTPTGKDTTTTGLQGKVQTGTPTFTPGIPEIPMDDDSPATFEDGNITKTIDKVGTYTVAKDGTVTFTPDKAFSGEAPEVTVKRVDKNGTTVTAKYKPIVDKVLPTGEGSETEGAKGKPQTSTIVFDKKDEDKSTVNFNKGDETVTLNPSTLTLVDKNGNPSTEVKVPGEGTYTLANNVVTFTPEKDFVGKATGVTVQVKDINGTPLEKTYTPTVRQVTTFVDPSGNLITVDKNNKPVESEVDGPKQPTKDIYGYKFVRTETDNKGNTKHIYEQAEGKSVKVTYVSTIGETLSDSQTVETKDKFIGTDYDASVESLKLERIEKDGKVYLLKERKTDSAAENGKLSDQEQTVTYVYEAVQEPASNQKYGNVVVVYKDKYGRPILGTTESGKEVSSTVIDTPNSPLTTKYDTTDHKPQTITTKDGKKYKLVKVLKTSDAEKSGVKARTSVITYVYEMLDNTTEYPEAHIGLVLVNYLDVEGNPISGKTPEGKIVPNMVVDTEADLVGKDYDTTDHKVSTIIVENGDVYELLKVSETSVEKGKLKEGTTNVDYIYHKVVTKFVDENGKEIQSPEKGRTDKKDIPEYTFKETKKDENGNTVHVYTKKSSSTPVTPTPSTPENGSLTIWKDGDGNNIKSPEYGKKEHSTIDGYIYERSEVDKDGNTVHIYRKVSSETPVVKEKETLFVDENGKPLQPAKKGQHPQENVPGYEFIRTETDVNGNVRHLYRAIAQSQATVNSSPTVEQRKNELPNTGTGDELAIFGAAAASILAGLGIAIPGKKKEEEK